MLPSARCHGDIYGKYVDMDISTESTSPWIYLRKVRRHGDIYGKYQYMLNSDASGVIIFTSATMMFNTSNVLPYG